MSIDMESLYKSIQAANAEIKTMPLDTKKGSKNYATVNERIVAFRKVFPAGFILTELQKLTEEECVIVARCGVYDDDGRPLVFGMGTAQELAGSSFINKTSYVENCETSAIGRALAACGFGIETAVASAEEVEHALAAQPIDALKVKALKAKCEADGVDIGKICAAFKVAQPEAITEGWYSHIINVWPRIMRECAIERDDN
jgi:galactitol-specific phosphotransferase system IIB component